MPNLDDNAEFAASKKYNLTGRLSHAKVVELATLWFPNILFHERERFHPIDLQTLFTAPPAVFETLSEAAKDEFRIEITTSLGTNRFDPPVVVVSESGNEPGHGSNAVEALKNSSISTDSKYSHGANLTASRKFFGASTTVSGDDIPGPGNPRVPRHLPIVVRAEMRFLLEALKHELQLDERPPESKDLDAVWGRFAVEELFFVFTGFSPIPFPRANKRAVLAKLIAAHEGNDQNALQEALNEIPLGWMLVQRAWNAIKGYAFLEFAFFYAFNDYKEYGTWPFVNEHEGDVEGCCVVFERRFFEDGTPLEEIVPHTLITSVHEEFNDNDGLKRLPVVRQRARDDLVVYVAPGSHATYLTEGAHDVLDFEDVVTDLPGELPTWLLIAALTLAPTTFAIVVLLAGIVEHFADSEDVTSSNGVSVGPGPADPENLVFEKQLEVTPLSDIESDLNIYQDGFRATLELRAFPGKWGADEDLIDKSPAWENKTARYFRNFLEYGDIQSELIL